MLGIKELNIVFCCLSVFFNFWIIVHLRQERLNSNDVKDGTLLSASWKTTRKVRYVIFMQNLKLIYSRSVSRNMVKRKVEIIFVSTGDVVTLCNRIVLIFHLSVERQSRFSCLIKCPLHANMNNLCSKLWEGKR